ncbi:MAG: protein kinase [Chloroflexi bacterium]|nr:protein kinase [Chloroflexota bacterium]
MALQVGQRLQNRYQIIRPLGKGGMGAVYLAQDGRLGGKSVAIKQFDPSGLPPQDRQWAASAFAQEANILAKLNHPALTAVTDYFTEYASHYLVMDYVEGETLEQAWLHQPGQRFDPASCGLGRAIMQCSGLPAFTIAAGYLPRP